MHPQKLIFILSSKKLMNQSAKPIWTNLNKVTFHGRLNESTKHFITKAMLGKIIHQRKENFISEFEVRERVIDILHVKDSGDTIAYEVESNKFDKNEISGVDTIEIKLKDVPNDLIEMEKCLKKVVV